VCASCGKAQSTDLWWQVPLIIILFLIAFGRFRSNAELTTLSREPHTPAKPAPRPPEVMCTHDYVRFGCRSG